MRKFDLRCMNKLAASFNWKGGKILLSYVVIRVYEIKLRVQNHKPACEAEIKIVENSNGRVVRRGYMMTLYEKGYKLRHHTFVYFA